MLLEKIPTFLLFIITVFCAVFCNAYKASYIRKNINNDSSYYLLNFGVCFVCSVFLFVLCLTDIDFSWFSFGLGIGFGVLTMLSLIFMSMAFKIGPYSYTNVIITLSTAVTALSGYLFWNEKLGFLKIIGVIIMLACVILAIDFKKDNESKVSIRWFLYSIFAMLCGVGIGIFQKIHQTSSHKTELNFFLFVSFFVSCVFSFLVFYFVKNNEKKKSINDDGVRVFSKDFVLASLFCGLMLVLNNILNLFLSGIVDSAVFFPIVNGIPLLLNIVISFLFFKEKLDVKQWIGILLGVVSVLFLCI